MKTVKNRKETKAEVKIKQIGVLEVCKTLGVSRSNLYRTFQSPEKLLACHSNILLRKYNITSLDWLEGEIK